MKHVFNSVLALTLMLVISLSFSSCLHSDSDIACINCTEDNNLSNSDIACIKCAEEFIVLWEAWDNYNKQFDEKIKSFEFVFFSKQEEDTARIQWAIDDEEQRLQKLTDFRVANSACLKLYDPEAMYQYLSPKRQ